MKLPIWWEPKSRKLELHRESASHVAQESEQKILKENYGAISNGDSDSIIALHFPTVHFKTDFHLVKTLTMALPPAVNSILPQTEDLAITIGMEAEAIIISVAMSDSIAMEMATAMEMEIIEAMGMAIADGCAVSMRLIKLMLSIKTLQIARMCHYNKQ